MLTKNHAMDVLKRLVKQGRQVTSRRWFALSAPSRRNLLIVAENGRSYTVGRQEFERWKESVRIFLEQSALFENECKYFCRPAGYVLTVEETDKLITLLQALYDNICYDVLEFSERDGVARQAACWTELPQAVRLLYINGHYAEAVFKAFVHLEEVIRQRMNQTGRYGAIFVRESFLRKDGLLSGTALSKADRRSLAELCAGAMGFIKNPGSHRLIKLPREKATELLFMANYLIRIASRPQEAQWDRVGEVQKERIAVCA